MAVVYLIEDLTNGFCYIGKTTKPPKQYWCQHIWFARRGDNQTWNKGLKTGPLSSETRQKISDATKGSHNAGSFYSGQVAWNNGLVGVTKQSDETKKKKSDAAKRNPSNEGRFKRGQKSHNATPEDVVALILSAPESESHKSVAVRLGICRQAVSRIRRGVKPKPRIPK